MEILDAKVKFLQGILQGQKVDSYQKFLKDMVGVYRSAQEEDPDKLLYTVYSYEAEGSNQAGGLYWGLTVLEPVTVNGECAMTRGHFHLDRSCAEFYFGISGTGLLLLMDDSGKTWAEKVEAGSVHYIDGRMAHRLINTGDEQLKVGACWPPVAGHDYAAIEKSGFGYRVFRRDGAIAWEEDGGSWHI